MANFARKAREKILQDHPNAVVFSRGKNNIKMLDGNTYIYEHRLGRGGVHFGANNDEIDTAWVTGDGLPYRLKMVLAEYNAFACVNDGLTFNAGQIVKYVHPASGASVTFQPQTLQWTNDLDQLQTVGNVGAVGATVVDDTLRWTNAYGTGLHFEWQALPTRLSKRLIVDSLASMPTPTPTILSGGNPVLRLQFIISKSAGVDMYIDGVLWNENSNNPKVTNADIEFRSGAETLWRFVKPFVYRNTPESVKTSVTMKARKQANNLFVEIRVPYSYLQTASYPLVIDPTVDESVPSGNDDADQVSGTVSLTNLIVTFNGSGVYAAWRFTTVAVPQGATINVSNGTCNIYGSGASIGIDIYCNDVDNASALAATSNYISNLALTTAKTSWSTTSVSGIDTLPSLNSPLQELVSRAGWAENNSLILVFVYASGDCTMGLTEDGDVPTLHIEYTAGAAGPVIPVFMNQYRQRTA